MKYVQWLLVIAATALVLSTAAVRLAGRSVAIGAAAVPVATHGAAGPSSDPFQTLLANSQDRGPVAPTRQVSVLLVLRDPTAAREAADLAATYNRHSRKYGHFKTAAQYAATYGPSAQAVARVQRVLRPYGLTVQWQKGNTWLAVDGPARPVERVFKVQIHDYIAPTGQHFYASAHDPTVPTALRREVSGTGHISSYLDLHGDARSRSAPVGGLAPGDLLAAYDLRPLRDRGLDGSGQTIVFWEIDAFSQSDLDAFTAHYNLPAMRPIVRGDKLTNVEGEANMDLQVVHEIAPKARLVVYNLDESKLQSLSDRDYTTHYFGFQDRMIRENQGATFSISLGSCDRVWGTALSQVFKRVYDKADQLGESIFVSSGDSGAYGCLRALAPRGTAPAPQYLGAEYPAVLPGVTSVGGTRLSVLQNGGWYDETVWEDALETEGSGGGLSANLARPSWQRGPGVQNQYSNGKREYPDVSADADGPSSVAVVEGGQLGPVGGTSQSAPIWAGMTALIDQYLKKQGLKPVGFMNPALYTLAATHQPYPPFHDVTVGGNLYYPATPGYDLATGLGTPDAWNLARDLAAYQRSATR